MAARLNIQPPIVGKWYVPRAPNGHAYLPRNVLAVARGLVLYSTSSGRVRECKIATFRRWTREVNARVATSRNRPRVLRLEMQQ